MTDDDALADVLRSCVCTGRAATNTTMSGSACRRLDTVQAAILIEKLKIFPDEIDARNRVARRYNDGLRDVAIVPAVPAGHDLGLGAIHARVSGRTARRACRGAEGEGIPTAIYYPIPLHRLQAYKHFPVGKGGVAVSDQLADEVISLPMHAYLDAATQDRMVDATRRALKTDALKTGV